MKNAVLSLALSLSFVAAATAVDPALVAANDRDVATPILPGWGEHFWNVNAKWYIHPPAFAFTNLEGAVSYRYRVLDDLHRMHEFTADSPRVSLAPVWMKLARRGFVTVTCYGLKADGSIVGLAGEKCFWKRAPFTPDSYAPAVCSYGEATRKAFRYLYGFPCLKILDETGEPDPSYRLNCYPSKMDSAIVNAMIHYAEADPSVREKTLRLARRAADYLIRTREPAGSPLEYFTQTYDAVNTNHTARQYAGQHMLIYPAEAGMAFVRLYRAVKDPKYLDAAEKIAQTYEKLRGADGTWYLKLYAKDGRPVNPNRLVPHGVGEFFEGLHAVTGKEEYRKAADRAFDYILRGPFEDWNWESQFEDIEPKPKYGSLTMVAGGTATIAYLLKRFPDNPEIRHRARQLLRFMEDQFIIWEKPCRADGSNIDFREPGWKGCAAWSDFPTALEQYDWYMPTDGSVASFLMTYLAFYEAEKNPLDLAKARALGDAYTRVQFQSGRIPTQWLGSWHYANPECDWFNCLVADACALEELGRRFSK